MGGHKSMKRHWQVSMYLVGLFLLTACGQLPNSIPTTTTSAPASPSATSSPGTTNSSQPKFVPDGTAGDNLEYFKWVVESIVANDSTQDSGNVASGIANSGFDPQTIQFTPSITTASLQADSVFVSVLFAGECLIAQYGPVINGVNVVKLKPLNSGGCLIGTEIKSLN